MHLHNIYYPFSCALPFVVSEDMNNQIAFVRWARLYAIQIYTIVATKG